MKKRKLVIGAFTTVLALTMCLSIYTRVRADDPPPDYWCIIEQSVVTGLIEPKLPIAYDCQVCEVVGAPFTYTIDDITYTETDRHVVIDTRTYHGCQGANHFGACTPTIPNPGYQVGECNNIIEVTSTGTGQ